MDALWPDAINTGILTRATPTFDVDILNEDAARAIEDMVREHYEESRPPSGAYRTGRRSALFQFRTEEPFSKIVVDFVARNGGGV